MSRCLPLTALSVVMFSAAPVVAAPLLSAAALQAYADADLISATCTATLFTDIGGSCSLVSGGQGALYVYHYIVVNPPGMTNEIFGVVTTLPKDAAFDLLAPLEAAPVPFLTGYPLFTAIAPHSFEPLAGKLAGRGGSVTTIVGTSHTAPRLHVAHMMFSTGRIPGQQFSTIDERYEPAFSPHDPTVPEPGLLLLVGAGALACGRRRRR